MSNERRSSGHCRIRKIAKKNNVSIDITEKSKLKKMKRWALHIYILFSLVFQLQEGVFNEKGRGEEFSLSRNVRNNGALFNGTRSHCVSADNCDGIQKKFRFAFDWKSITGPFVRIEWPEMTLLQCKK